MIPPTQAAPNPRGRVFLTGATGLVGSHVAEQLRERGHSVRALHRARSDVSFLRGLGCELVEGDLGNQPEALAAAMAGCEAVVHAAAIIYTGTDWPSVRAINVGGTERVLRAAARAGARRIVYFSSVAVHGDPRGRPDETSPLDAPLGPRELYARSKRETEAMVHSVGRELGLEVTILRPAAVYGERDRLFTPQLVAAFRAPIQPILGDGSGTIPAVYAGNVADAALLALGSPGGAPGSRVYELGEDHPVTPLEMYAALARGLGVPFRPVHLPRALVLAGARLAGALGLRIPGAEELPIGRTARLAMGPNPFGSARLRAELGWSPPVPLERALERTAAWAARERAALGLAR